MDNDDKLTNKVMDELPDTFRVIQLRQPSSYKSLNGYFNALIAEARQSTAKEIVGMLEELRKYILFSEGNHSEQLYAMDEAIAKVKSKYNITPNKPE